LEKLDEIELFLVIAETKKKFRSNFDKMFTILNKYAVLYLRYISQSIKKNGINTFESLRKKNYFAAILNSACY
jgi:hypothetical protein